MINNLLPTGLVSYKYVTKCRGDENLIMRYPLDNELFFLDQLLQRLILVIFATARVEAKDMSPRVRNNHVE
jgi:hypothetical protein